MKTRTTRWLTPGALFVVHAALLSACGGETGSDLGLVTERVAAKDEARVVDNLRQAFPAARMQMRGSRVRSVFGAILATGDTADQAAERARDAFRGALKAGSDDLHPVEGHNGLLQASTSAKPIGVMLDQRTGEYKFWLYRYGQRVQGIPVHDAELRVLAKNQPGFPVVWAGSTLRHVADFSPPSLPATLRADRARSEQALAAGNLLRGSTRTTAASLDRIGSPEPVIFAGDGDNVVPPRLAARYTAEDGHNGGAWQFVADAATGDVLHIVSRWQNVNVTGRVRGNATVVGAASAECSTNQTTPLPYAEVEIPGQTSAFTGELGYYNLTNAGATQVEVVSRIKGHYFDVVNYANFGAGPDEELSQTVAPPGPANFLHNAGNTDDAVRAQVNAYVHVNRVRDFLLSYRPAYPGVSTQTDYEVRANGDWLSAFGDCPANAAHYADYLVFCSPGQGTSGPPAVNTAIPSVIYHEYGHEIVEEGGSGQGPYGEGMADTISSLMTGDPRMALGVVPGECESTWRTADNDCQYDPDDCSDCGGLADPPHLCGRLLSGIMWDIREALKAKDPTGYGDVVNALILGSITEHDGTGIDATIATELLTLDDGAHTAEICAGFEAHGITCPAAPKSPCSDICDNPISFSWTNNYQSGPLGTGAVCRETTQPVVGGNCGNLASPRKLYVNGTQMTCNGGNWSTVPPKRNGGYCVSTTPGNHAWAFFTMW